ncbi:uncharacterized protein JCM6883_005365 [Sporobolomyces salmoneus]|uniref:uncharacterized protein n=1 Tax=Sporobolomyces salmoneus TaxID=183962 RepID=UPI003171A87A
MDDSQLVRELTEKLETLQHEKQRLERAIEGQADSIALKLRLALLAAGESGTSSSRSRSTRNHAGHSDSQGRRRKLSSTSPSSSISTSSSTSFPSSPSPLLSPLLPNAQASPAPDVVAALRENSELRTKLANSERVNQYYQREIADLRRICGVSIDELEELDPRSHSYAPGATTRRRSISSRSNGASTSTVGSIRIPGASSVSPPSIRPSTSSFPSQLGHSVAPYSYSHSLSSSSYYPSQQNPRFLPHSYTSSINTTLTTPSSSFPIANPPAPTPSTSLDFDRSHQGDQTLLILPTNTDLSPLLLSPDSVPSSSISSSSFNSSHSRPPRASTVAGPSTPNRPSSGLELEDSVEISPNLLPSADTPTKLSIITSLDTTSTNSRRRTTMTKRRNGSTRGKGKQTRTLQAINLPETSQAQNGKGEEEEEEGESVDDPLVLAVTNSLKKLIAQNEGSGSEEGTIRRRLRRFSNEVDEELGEVREEEDQEGDTSDRGSGKDRATSSGEFAEEEADDDDDYTTEEELEDDDDDGSSTTSREEGKYEQLRAEISRLQKQVQMGQQQRTTLMVTQEYEETEVIEEDDDGTPLSVSPKSRRRSRRESSAGRH